MKELTIEEKAKAYDKAINVAKSKIKNDKDHVLYENDIIEIFPELVESKDERIRKELLNAFKEATDSLYMVLTPSKREAFIAWLEKKGGQKQLKDYSTLEITDVVRQALQECKSFRNIRTDVYAARVGATVEKLIKKQGEQNPADTNNKFIRMRENKPKDIAEFLNRLTTVEQEFLWEHIAKIRELDKEEQKYIDKVEPKFKVGDWIVVNDGRIGRIIECTKDFANVDLDFSRLSTSINNIRSWTIQDAKAGDVLVDSLGNVCIYQEPSTKLMYHSFCFGNHKWFIDGGGSHKIVGTCPATKEQSNLLFQKMKEAGYEWDAEKKGLKKISQEYPLTPDECIKSSWSEEDENMLGNLLGYLNGFSVSETDKHQMFDWLKSLKDRVQPQPKQEWSEEDERIKNNLLSELTNLSVRKLIEKETENKYVNWLKSLRSQNTWRPSEEMLEALYRAIPENTMAISEDEMLLDKLYQGLKYGRVLSNK